ncbi:MAG: chorismate synthase [Candidatus Omnitrophica bacterium]|nr:chorismate synthase [Candidatus Omnitrophota bacterium]MBU2436253.1 chorismate synthase [Candidatus Omnitrophota bacterium]
MRILTAGESHGTYMAAILEGFPKGVKIEKEFIDCELKRRMSGLGRGKRMSIEIDKVEIVSGLRNKVTLGSPITILVKNKDAKIFSQKKDNLTSLSIPRPAHADLAGALKYQENDLRNILERASARETVSRVGLGAICKQFLLNFNIKITSFTISVGDIISQMKPKNILEIISKVKNSKLNCIDREAEKLIVREVEKAQRIGDSLGGVVEVWAEGSPPGLGSFMHFDKRLDSQLAAYLMSIPAVKGVEIGLGFEYARKRGSASHDAIYYTTKKNLPACQQGFYRKTNNSGGIEGGISTGEPIVLRIAMKPIATLGKPLDSVNLTTKQREKAPVIRSDTCAIVACGVIAESMAAICLTEAFLDKFGGDALEEIKTNYKNYIKAI